MRGPELITSSQCSSDLITPQRRGLEKILGLKLERAPIQIMRWRKYHPLIWVKKALPEEMDVLFIFMLPK